MGQKLTERIETGQPRLYFGANESMPVYRQSRDFLFRQRKLEGYRLERPPAPLEPLLEHLDFIAVERYDFGQFRHESVEVADAFPDQRQAENRPVFSQGNAVAVVDDAACRGQRLQADAVFVRPGLIDIVLPDLQLHHAKHQHQCQSGRDGEQHHRPADECLVFLVLVLDAKRWRHGMGELPVPVSLWNRRPGDARAARDRKTPARRPA